jgi:ketosteroid isomerase-like protein
LTDVQTTAAEMALQMTRTNDEAQIRALVDDWARAVRAKDLDAIFAHYAPDILAFDAIARLQFEGTEAYRKHWQACMAMCPGQMIFEVHDLGVAAGDDVAFCHYLSRCGGTGADGEERPDGCARPPVCADETESG